MKNQVNWTGFLLTFIGSVLFSTKAVMVKVAFAHTDMKALTLLTLRMLFSMPFYIGAAWLAWKKNQPPITRMQWWIIAFLGLFGYYLSSLLDFLGLEYITAGLERLILFLYPTFAVLINALLFKVKVTKIQVTALVLTYIGIGIAFFGELQLDTGNPDFVWGSFLIFLCAVTFSVYIVGSGRMIPEVGVTRFTAYAMLAATAGIFTQFAFQGSVQAIENASAHWWYGLYLAIFTTVIPTFLVSAGLKRIGANNVAIISAIGPVATIIQAHYVLGEPIFTEQIIGTLFVIIGVLLIGWKQPKN